MSAIVYALRSRPGESEPIQCDSCNCEAPTADFDWGPSVGQEKHVDPKRPLCEFCATTMAGSHTRYFARDDAGLLRQEVWRAAGAVFNMLKHPPKDEA